MCFWLVNILNGVAYRSAPQLGSPQTAQPGLRSCSRRGGAIVEKSALQRASLNYEKSICATLALGVNGGV